MSKIEPILWGPLRGELADGGSARHDQRDWRRHGSRRPRGTDPGCLALRSLRCRRPGGRTGGPGRRLPRAPIGLRRLNGCGALRVPADHGDLSRLEAATRKVDELIVRDTAISIGSLFNGGPRAAATMPGPKAAPDLPRPLIRTVPAGHTRAQSGLLLSSGVRRLLSFSPRVIQTGA